MKGKMLKTAVLASAMLFGAHANALSLNFDIIDETGFSPDPNSGVESAFIFDFFNYSGNSFTTIAPEEGETFLDVGTIQSSTGTKNSTVSFTSTTIETDGNNAPIATITNNYTLSVTFTDWVGTYYDVTDAENFSAVFTEGSADWYLTTETITTDLTDFDVLTGSFATDTVTSTTIDPVLSLDLVEGEGNITNGTGDIDIIFEVTTVDPGLIYVDSNGDNILTEDEDLAGLLAALDPQFEGYYLGYTFGTNTIIDSAAPEYADDLYGILEAQGLASQDANGDWTVDPSVTGFVAQNVGGLYFATVAEPATLGMMSLALLGFAGFQRRRKNNS